MNFEKDFLGTKIIKLEQNYRCTWNILKAANAVIKNNQVKYDKKLWTQNDEGNLPSIYLGDDEYNESNYIVSKINELRREQYYKYSDFAILYRMNSQSRAIEDILRREKIPYKIIGGQKFYERKEIKDVISYLRLIYNTSDNLALKRIINEPKRGIGKTSLDSIQEISEKTGTSMYEIIKHAEQFGLNRVYINSREFIETIEDLVLKTDTDDSEAVFISCTNVEGFHISENLEKKIKKPVVSSNIACLWALLKAIPNEVKITDRGTLLRDYLWHISVLQSVI